MSNPLFKRFANVSLLTSVGKLATFCKVSFIVGSHTAFFSLGNCIGPAVGRYGGRWSALLYYLLLTFIRIFTLKSFSISLVVYHIPTLCGALFFSSIAPYHQSPSKKFRIIAVLLPLVCIVAFSLHPLGNHAVLYTLPWIFSSLIACGISHNIFLVSLATTLTSHAVGSVMWLYTHPLSAEVWLALIPLVCLERVVLALGLTSCCALYEIGVQPVKQFLYSYKKHSLSL